MNQSVVVCIARAHLGKGNEVNDWISASVLQHRLAVAENEEVLFALDIIGSHEKEVAPRSRLGKWKALELAWAEPAQKRVEQQRSARFKRSGFSSRRWRSISTLL